MPFDKAEIIEWKPSPTIRYFVPSPLILKESQPYSDLPKPKIKQLSSLSYTEDKKMEKDDESQHHSDILNFRLKKRRSLIKLAEKPVHICYQNIESTD